VLHVTNGDCAVEVLREAGLRGDFLPWRDVLHEGPVDPSLALEALRRLRVDFIAKQGWGSRGEVEKSFRDRDARLARSREDDEVVLWFEHDLYDQLQLIQLLHWFEAHPHPRLTMVCEAEYLGEMKAERAAELFEARRPVSAAQLDQGSRAWRGLPHGRGFPELPFLDAALERWAAEPSRTERLVVEALEQGPLGFEALFRKTQARDEPRFLGDTIFLQRLQRLEAAGRVKRENERWRLA